MTWKKINFQVILMTIIIIILLVLLLLFAFKNESKEHFQIVGYNASDIPCYDVQSIYSIETNKLTDLFKKQESFDKSNYTLYNNNITFIYTDQVKKVLSEYLKNLFNNKDKISITTITNIYFDDQNNYILNAQLLNSTNFTTRNLLIKINILGPLISILSVKLDTNDTNIFDSSTTSGRDTLLPDSLYRIKNTLHLLDPFLTSSNDP
jgi:hypothetical protein